MSQDTEKIGLFRIDGQAVSPEQIGIEVKKNTKRQFILRTSLLVLIAGACIFLFITKESAPSQQPIDPYLHANQTTADNSKETAEGLLDWARSNISTSNIDFSQLESDYREAANAYEENDFYTATKLFDQCAKSLAQNIGNRLEHQFDTILNRDRSSVLARYNPALSKKLAQQRSYIESTFADGKFDEYVIALSQLCEVSLGAVVELHKQLTADAKIAQNEGRLAAAAPLYADLSKLDPANSEASNFFRYNFYRQGDTYTSPSGISFTYIEPDSSSEDSGFFVSTLEIDKRVCIQSLGRESLDSDDFSAISAEQVAELRSLLQMTDKLDYSYLDLDIYKNHITLPPKSDTGKITFNAYGISHTNNFNPEWVLHDKDLSIVAFDGSDENPEDATPILVQATKKARAHVRLTFVPDRFLKLTNR